ncbi:LuxR C-terminal-related transcriptional regulator [Nakamurella aerolata]|uniref:LuxR C-terminal-related transcriptional regulator n=1 Tax=Nakamurella aerolata TaxID=1656892 RepID=UPI001BB1BD2A|nr:LuxR C-terminal-related transcriptional regulator [Nakamurella aerolata]
MTLTSNLDHSGAAGSPAQQPAGPLLPRPRQATDTTDAATVPAAGGVRVLIADPDATSRESRVTALRESGLTSVTAPSDVSQIPQQLIAQPGGNLLLVSLTLGPAVAPIVEAAKEAGWSRVIALAPAAEIGPVIDAIGAGIHGVLVGRRANPATASVPSTVHELSSREVEVLRLVADGRSNKWIGDYLSLSALTVKSHLARIGRKLGTGDRAHMVVLALRAGVIS